MNVSTSGLNVENVPVFCDRWIFGIFVCLGLFIISSIRRCRI